MKKFISLKGIFIFICLLLIVLTIIRVCINFNSFGWDNKVICGGVKCFYAGQDPYYVQNLQKYSHIPDLPFVYFPLALILFFPLCFFSTPIVYYTVWLLFLLLIFLFAKKIDKLQGKADNIFLITILITGFSAFYINLLTGNIGLIEGVIFSISLFFIVKERYYASAILLGIISSLKLFPITLSMLFLLVKGSWKKKLTITLICLLGFLFMHLLSTMLFPTLTVSYIKTITGSVDGQFKLIEEFGEVNPSSYAFLKETLSLFVKSNMAFYFAYISFCLVIAILFVMHIRSNKEAFFEKFCLGVIGMMLIWIRLKPYSFIWALLPIYLLVKESSFKKKMLILGLISFIPDLVILLGGYIFPSFRSTILFGYTNFFCLLAVYLLLVFKKTK
jgi:hypothetical protein